MVNVGGFCSVTPRIHTRVQLSNWTKFGRFAAGLLLGGGGPHQFAIELESNPAFPSNVPVPLISTSVRVFPKMKGVVPLVQLLFGSICSFVPLSICRLTLLFMVIGPDK